MRQESDIRSSKAEVDEAADRACREIRGQVEAARRRLLGEYRSILRHRPADNGRG